jgi:L,D-peptidoglycan transpeptidase YkuD (ErfK/YbiS/YcfS/YnhG family)
MRRLAAAAVPAALLVALLAGLLVGAASPAQADATLDGVQVRTTARTTQAVTVNHTRGYHARVTWWTREPGGPWEGRRVTTDGRIGYGGLVRAAYRRQGSGTTPLGTFRLPWAFGRHLRDDAWRLPYRRIRLGDYWVQDNASDFYNRYRNRSQGGFRWWLPTSDVNSSERLMDFPLQYEYVVVTDFNRAQVPHRGSGIFLHVNGSGATAGCVSAPRPFLRMLMRALNPTRRPVIAIGR